MDKESLAALKHEFGPLEGFDVTQLPYPEHHLAGAKLVGFPMKPYALLHSRFKQALLLDCDVVLAKDPEYMFDTPEFVEYGNLFWADIYSDGMVKKEAYDYVGVNRSLWDTVDGGKGEFVRYAESGQLMVDRTRHLDVLEWVWFLNSFGDKHVYEFMYGDKDTYGLGFSMAGKGHLYQQVNIPPAGVFTNLANLGWSPRREQMNKQGNWWLQAFAHYDPAGDVLLFHRVTGELSLGKGTPYDEVITPPIPVSWSMWFMGYGPSDALQHTLEVTPLNVSRLLAAGGGGQACPLMAWAAYWTLRTHGIPIDRRPDLEAACWGALRAQYGDAGAVLIRAGGLLEHPIRLAINSKWEEKINGGWNAPPPLMAVPLNMTKAYSVWTNMDAALKWTNEWAPKHIAFVKRGRRLWQRPRRARRLARR
ncbi:MAG: mannosyltransferase putative-domain-containing protein [Monoraphidium minutum]|nr:MAG: mannosyltransferase putative-domain-containing protein [Monoraphidium minutum]